MKKRVILTAILATSLAMTPLVGLAMEQNAPQPELAVKEEKPIGGLLRLLTAFGPGIGSSVLEIVGLEELGKEFKNLVTTINELTKELKKKQIDPQSVKKTIQLLAKTQEHSELIQKDLKKLAKFVSKFIKFFAWVVPKKQKEKLITVKIKNEQGNLVDKKITVGEYLKNAPEYLLNVSFWVTEKWQKIVKTLLEKSLKQIKGMEKTEAERNGIKYIPSQPITEQQLLLRKLPVKILPVLPVETMKIKETITTPTKEFSEEVMESEISPASTAAGV